MADVLRLGRHMVLNRYADEVYVLASDYDALAAEFAEFKKAAAEAADWGLERNARLAEAIATLQSIASNTCCDGCNEAALVACAFLRPADSAAEVKP